MIAGPPHKGATAAAFRPFLCACMVALAASCLIIPASAAARRPLFHFYDRPFQDFIASLWPLAEQRGISHATFDTALAGVSYDPKIIDRTTRQAEFDLAIRDYLEGAVTAGRVQRGRDMARTEGAWLAKARRDYGVGEAAVLGVWGLETDFGRFPGSDDVLAALTSLAFAHFHQEYFRDELMSALLILQEGKIARRDMRGSWAGAMGQTQFMPSSFLLYAVDFERHGRRDIWNSVPDAIGSTACFLAAHGWNPDLPWGFEVRLPATFELTDADSSRPAAFTVFAGRGVTLADGAPLPNSGEARLLIPAGLGGPIFLVTRNFDILKMYNNSTSYALAVALLGDMATGGGGLVGRWPARDRPLREPQVRSLQAKLKKMGYDVGEIDGKAGDALRSAVRAYQERNGLSPDGYASLALLKRMDAKR